MNGEVAEVAFAVFVMIFNLRLGNFLLIKCEPFLHRAMRKSIGNPLGKITNVEVGFFPADCFNGVNRAINIYGDIHGVDHHGIAGDDAALESVVEFLSRNRH
jgi:hypothetical protein